MSEPVYEFDPDYAVTIGDVVTETMAALNLIGIAGIGDWELSEILGGHMPIRDYESECLEKATRIPARFWLSLQEKCQEHAKRVELNHQKRSCNET